MIYAATPAQIESRRKAWRSVDHATLARDEYKRHRLGDFVSQP
jgi:hypothetical protein